METKEAIACGRCETTGLVVKTGSIGERPASLRERDDFYRQVNLKEQRVGTCPDCLGSGELTHP